MATQSVPKTSLHLFIRSREKLLFDGPALSVSSVNESGLFDILPEHANFISIIKDFISIRLPDGKTQKITINNAILKAINNEVKIYLGIVANKPAPKSTPPKSAATK